MKVRQHWDFSSPSLSFCSLMHLPATKGFLAVSVIVSYLNFISFLLIVVSFLSGVSTLPRLEASCFAKSRLLFPYAFFLLLSSHHSCCPPKSRLLLNIPCNLMAQNENIIQTRQQHCSSQQGIIFKTRIVNATAFVCSAEKTNQRAVLNAVLTAN